MRKGSMNDMLASLGADVAEEKGASVERASMADFECPPYDLDTELTKGLPAGAQALHDELLGHRPEARATLLVAEDNAPAQRAYATWGWRKLGKLQPFPDSPHYDALVLDLAASYPGPHEGRPQLEV